MMYKSMIIGAATNMFFINNVPEMLNRIITINRYRTWFPFQAIDLNLNENILIGITNIADMTIDVYAAESILLRVEKKVGMKGEEACAADIDMVRVFFNDAADRINKAGKEGINAHADGDEQRMMLMGLRRFTKVQPFNTKEARRNVAAALIEANQYCF